MNCTARTVIKETVGVKKDNRVSQEKARPVQRILGQNSSINQKQPPVKGLSSGSVGFKINTKKIRKTLHDRNSF